MQARVDYIMIVPATPTERPFPMYGFRYNPGHTAGVDIDRHFHGNKTLFKESGCLSDHAEVVGYLDLVPYVVKSPPNPKRANRVRWYVTHLFDIYNDDDTAFDDGSTDWFTNNLPDEFLLMGRDLAGAEIAGTCNHGNQTWFAPEGRDVAGGIPWDYRGPLLYDGYTSNLMLAVWDHDGGSNHDWYDANPFPGYKNLDLVVDLANRAITERGGANTKVTNFFNQNVVKMTSRGWEGASANVEFYIETCEANQSPAYYPCIPKNCP
jgi:hypothetical protein